MIMEEESVQFVRLNTGEDLVAEVTQVQSDDNAHYILHNPMKIVYQIGGSKGSLAISLMQWVFNRICENQDFIIYPQDILTMNKTTEGMEDYYWESVDHFIRSKDKLEKNTIFEDAVEEQNDLLSEIHDLLKTTNKRKLN
jgi:hypothetical protein